MYPQTATFNQLFVEGAAPVSVEVVVSIRQMGPVTKYNDECMLLNCQGLTQDKEQALYQYLRTSKPLIVILLILASTILLLVHQLLTLRLIVMQKSIRSDWNPDQKELFVALMIIFLMDALLVSPPPSPLNSF